MELGILGNTIEKMKISSFKDSGYVGKIQFHQCIILLALQSKNTFIMFNIVHIRGSDDL